MVRARRKWRFWIGTGLIALAALGIGFVVFANAVLSEAPVSPPHKADGIVALTGTQQRISVAADLLARGLAKRLLVTGVNRQATGEEIRRLTQLDQRLFDCCVDLGYEAQNTIGNAEETRAWVQQHGFTSLIVVTSSYHMPRSLVELGRVMPDVELIPYPVAFGQARDGAWWTNPALVRLLVAEYLKFLPSAARYALARLVNSQGIAAAKIPDRS
jgi:uncharacterized SAM-binding protein YcdF (DUF218 family)